MQAPVGAQASFADLPLLLTVTQAAEVLSIGRSLAYQLARCYLATCGEEGLPVIRLGSCLRVPRWALVALVQTGQVVNVAEAMAAHPAESRDAS
jgi:hypothetical protein